METENREIGKEKQNTKKLVWLIAAGYDHTVGLRSDGTVVAVGWNRYSQREMRDWTDIRIPKAPQ